MGAMDFENDVDSLMNIRDCSVLVRPTSFKASIKPHYAYLACISLNVNSLFDLGSLRVRIVAGLGNGLSALCDILIALGLCFHLHTSRSGFKTCVFARCSSSHLYLSSDHPEFSTDTMIDRLMLYAIACGALTA